MLHTALIRPRLFVKLFNKGWPHAPGWWIKQTDGAKVELLFFLLLPFSAWKLQMIFASSHCWLIQPTLQDLTDRRKTYFWIIWSLYLFSFSVFSSCWFAKSQLTGCWAMSCLSNRAFVLVCAPAKTGKTCSHALFSSFLSSSPIGSCRLYTCKQGGAYLSCGKLPYKNWGSFFHYPRAFLASWRLWWMLQKVNSVLHKMCFGHHFLFLQARGGCLSVAPAQPFK